MPMVPMDIDNSTVAVTSMITAVITFFFATTVGQIKPAAALALAVIIGFILYAIGVIPIGLLFVAGISMIVAIFKTTASTLTSSEPNSEIERRRTLGYVDGQQQPNTNTTSLNQGAANNILGVAVNNPEQLAKSGYTRAQAMPVESHHEGTVDIQKDQQLIAARKSSTTHEQFIREKPYQSKTPEGAMKPNLYQILGVQQNASQSDLDAAYTELLAKHRALHNQGIQDTSNELVLIKWAYEHLVNTDKRAAYDMKLGVTLVKPRIVNPISKTLSQHTTANQGKEEAQTDTPSAQFPYEVLRMLAEKTYDEAWAIANEKGLPDQSCHEAANINVFIRRYEAEPRAPNIPLDEMIKVAKWESSPFNLLPHRHGKIALIEYIVWREYPDKADMEVVIAAIDNLVSHLKENNGDELLNGFRNAPFFAWIPWRKLIS